MYQKLHIECIHNIVRMHICWGGGGGGGGDNCNMCAQKHIEPCYACKRGLSVPDVETVARQVEQLDKRPHL